MIVFSLQSLLHLVFRDEKDPNVELQHWRYWHAQQANPQQRAFDIGKLTEKYILGLLKHYKVTKCVSYFGTDRKACQNIEEHIDEIAYNAAAFYWNTSMNAKVSTHARQRVVLRY